MTSLSSFPQHTMAFPPPPLPLAPYPQSHSSNPIPSPLPTPLTTPLAPPPPPPLHLSSQVRIASKPARQVPYAGAEHTLGPTFSDEEDGDDSEWIAQRMMALGLAGERSGQRKAPGLVPDASLARSQAAAVQQRQHAMQQFQQQQQQQQYELYSLLASQPSLQQPTAHARALRESLALLELRQAQQASTMPAARQHAQARYLAQQQQQYLEQKQREYLLHLQQSALLAQAQAQASARTSQLSPDNDELKKRFESVPNITTSPSTSTSPRRTSPISHLKSPPPPAAVAVAVATKRPGRFAQAQKEMADQNDRAIGVGKLTAALTRRTTSGSDDDRSSLGRGVPSQQYQQQQGNGRNLTVPAEGHRRMAQGSQRAVSTPQPSGAEAAGFVFVSRQPLGPPGGPDELGEKNFQARMRRQAGLGLGMLGRRASPATTPVLA